MADLTSRLYRPSPAYCCEACVFGRGAHAQWCTAGQLTLDVCERALRDFLTAPFVRIRNPTWIGPSS